jgi:hypothetical protein
MNEFSVPRDANDSAWHATLFDLSIEEIIDPD